MRARKRDANESEIVKELRACGYLVKYLNEWDLQVCRRNDKMIWMMEVKTEDGEIRKSQQELIDEGWPLHIVRNVEDAMAIVRRR